MPINKFLDKILENQKLEDDELEVLISHREDVEKKLREKFGSSPIIKYGGSKAKGTMIQESYDLDIVCYFQSDSAKTLKEIYTETSQELEKYYIVEEKKSAIRIIKPKDSGEIIDFHIDVVPGKFTDETKGDCYLYQNVEDRERLKTNIKTHIDYVKDSGQAEIIKLAKLWKTRWQLDFKTFVLEVFIVNNISGNSSLKNRFKIFLKEIEACIEDCTLTDPANSANIVSDILTASDKSLIKQKAKECLDLIVDDELSSWHEVFDEAYNESENEVEDKALILLSDSSHQLVPTWPSGNGRVVLKAETFAKLDSYNVSLGVIKSDSITLPKSTWIRFTATTDISPPFQVFWQVVNTGEDARDNGGLRGNLEAGGLTREEHTGYRGKHFMICHIVKDGKVTSSKKFYVNVSKLQLRVGKRKFKGPRLK